MAECNHCGKSILFGGRRLDGARYCGARCAARHPLLKMAERVPEAVLQQHVRQWRMSDCPHCKRPGPLDVYRHHRVHSLVLMTQWHTRQRICCRRCGRRSQLGSALYSAALGWWGVPWGVLVTPLQVGRNIVGMCRGAPAAPSAQLERLVRLHLAEQALQAPPAPASS